MKMVNENCSIAIKAGYSSYYGPFPLAFSHRIILK